MNARALGASGISVAPLGNASYRLAYAGFACAVAALSATSGSNDATLALDRFIAGGALATHLGAETFTASGHATGAAGWLGASVVTALGTGLGGTLAATLVALVTFALVERRARRFAPPVFGLCAAVLAALCAIGSFGAGGGIVTAAFAVALVELLELPGVAAPLGASLLALVWCNVAPQGLLASGIAFVVALGAALEGRDADRRRMLWFACAGTLVAMFATPGFVAFPAIALEELRLDPSLGGVVALHPTDTMPIAYRAGFIATTFVAYWFGVRRGRAADALLFLTAGWLALSNGIYLPVFGVLVTPLLAASAAEAFSGGRVAGFAFGRTDVIFAGGAAIAALALAASLAPRSVAPETAYGLAASLAADGRPHRLYCASVDWCDAALGGATRVFMDGRIGAYPPAIRKEQHDIARLSKGWREILERRRVDAVLARKGRAIAGVLALLPGWHVVAKDDDAVLYERGVAP